VVLEGVRARLVDPFVIPEAGALLPARHDIGPVGGEQHGVGREHAERLHMGEIAEHLDEPPDLHADVVRHSPGEPVSVLESRSHLPVYRPEGPRIRHQRHWQAGPFVQRACVTAAAVPGGGRTLPTRRRR
jgi:hypothetical protein